MVILDSAPFMGDSAFNKATDRYVPFPTSSDAMLASLQLFHDVPCRIMDLVISVVTHPDFRSELVTLKESADVIRITEEARLRARVAVIYERSLNASGHMEQTNLPQFVLYDILDIIKASREERITEIFGKGYANENDFNGKIEENHTLSNMSLVHRSWTSPAQKALGQFICIRKAINKLDVRSNMGTRNIFGPWTTVAAVALLSRDDTDFGGCRHYSKIDIDRDHIEHRDLEHFENLHRLLLTFRNLKKLYFRSYEPILTSWSNSTVEAIIRQNACLTELTLESMMPDWEVRLYKTYNLDFLVKDFAQNIRKLTIRGGTFSEEFRRSATHTATLPHLCSLTMGGTPDVLEDDFEVVETFFHILSARPRPNFKSLSFDLIEDTIIDEIEKGFNSEQCAKICQHLQSSSIYLRAHETGWIKWLATHSKLKDLQLHVYANLLQLPALPTSIENFAVTFYEYMTIESLLICKDTLLKLICSSGRPTLKAVAIVVTANGQCAVHGQMSEEEIQNLYINITDEMSRSFAETGIKLTIEFVSSL